MARQRQETQSKNRTWPATFEPAVKTGRSARVAPAPRPKRRTTASGQRVRRRREQQGSRPRAADLAARKPEPPKAATGERFVRIESRGWGYDPVEVEDFFDDVEAMLEGNPGPRGEVSSSDVRSVTFNRARHGYDPVEVDAGLDRMENVLAERENRAFIREHGRDAWESRVAALSDVIFGRLERPDGQRFRSPAGTSTRGYAVVDVDALCREVVEQLSQYQTMDPDHIRSAVFGPATGENSYEEQQVDAFLDKLVELLLALR